MGGGANLGTAWIQVKPSMNGVRGSILSGLKGTGADFGDQMGGEVQKSRGMTVGMAAMWGAASAVALKAIDTISQSITQSINGAIRRVDTLNNSSRTFANMGFDANTSAKAVKTLEQSIMGLPTPLDSAIRGMTSLAATYGDVSLGQKVFTSLNNAILGFGGTAEMVDNAILQISQMPMDGPLDAQTWNSLRNSGLTPVLVAMAKDAGVSVGELRKQFGEGERKVGDFVSALITMNEKGGGGLKSLEAIAKDSTKGIETSTTNASTAIARGVASIVTAIGSDKIAGAIKGTGAAIETVLKAVAAGITELPKIIDSVVKSFQSMVQFVKENSVAFGAFAVSLGAIATPMAVAAAQALILDLRIRAMLLWDTVIKVIKGTAAAFKLLTVAMAANPILAIIAVVGILVGAFALLWKNNEGFRNFFIGAWTQIQKTFGDVVSSISTAWGTVSTAIGNVTNQITNLINSGINALNSAFQATVGWIEQNATLLTNIGIIITTLLLPKLVQMGIEFVKMATQAVVSAARAGAAWVVEFVKMQVQSAKTGALSVLDAIKTGAAWVAQAVKTSIAWVTQTLPRMIASFAVASASAVANAAIAGAAWVAQAASTTVAWAGMFVKYLAGIAIAATQTVLAGARMAAGWLLAMGPIGLIVALVAGAVALIIANWDTVKSAVLSVWNGIVQGAQNAWNWVKNIFGGVGSWFSGVFSGALNGITGIWNRVGSIFSGFYQNIVNAFSGVANIGRNIVEGLWNGISNMGGWIQSKIKGFGESVLKGLKDFFGIHSPSTLMRDEIGENIPGGVGVGIMKNTKSAVNAAIKSSRAILGAFNTDAGFSGGMIPSASLAMAGAGGNGNTFYVTNPSPEETAEIIASRIKTQGGL